jgi:hypothetical protein
MGEQVPPWTRRPCDQCGVEHQATRAEPRPGPLVCDVCAVHLQYAARIRELEAALAKAQADAEVGRLLREAADRWPAVDIVLIRRMIPAIPPARRWLVYATSHGGLPEGYGPTPAEALRALLGET